MADSKTTRRFGDRGTYPQKPTVHVVTMGVAVPKVTLFYRPQKLIRTVSNWDGVLPMNLFVTLTTLGVLTRDEIFEIFWPDLSVKEATNVFHVTKRKINERLFEMSGIHGMTITEYFQNFYQVGAKHPEADRLGLPVTETNRMFILNMDALKIRRAAAQDKISVSQIRRILKLYGGPFLYGIKLKWVQEYRTQLDTDMVGLLIRGSRMVETSHEKIGFLGRAHRIQPFREDVTLMLMELFASEDRHVEAMALYDSTRKYLNDTMRITPGRPLQTLAEDIQQRLA